jgi:hypothetical protein
MCTPSCGTVWNTFETRAVCPGCGKQWRETCCLGCLRWSLHEDWYHDEETDTATKPEESELELVSVGDPAA